MRKRSDVLAAFGGYPAAVGVVDTMCHHSALDMRSPMLLISERRRSSAALQALITTLERYIPPDFAPTLAALIGRGLAEDSCGMASIMLTMLTMSKQPQHQRYLSTPFPIQLRYRIQESETYSSTNLLAPS